MLIYLNGKFVPKEEAKISVFDHGLLYGDGVFEGIRSYNGRVFKLYEHLERLYASAKYIMLEIPLTMDEMAEVVLESIRVNQLRDAYVRLVVTRGVGDLGLSPQKCPRPTIFCIADQIELYPSRFYEEGLELISVPTRRNAADALDPRVKSLNYLNNILAKIEGELCGYAEALMVDRNGYVLEGTGANIFLYRRGTLVTPPAYVGALEGITRAVVIELAREEGFQVVEELFTRYEVYTAEECFLTGTAAELIPVVRVDGRKIGSGKPGPVTQQLTEAFHRLTQVTGTPVYSE